MATNTITVSIDAMRRNTAQNYLNAHRTLETLFEKMDGAYSYLTDKVKEAMNDLNSSISSLFYIHISEVSHFSDLTDEVDKIFPETFDLD
ncbi:hypothetical protein ACQ0P8_05730 [Halodesulfovibrio aestuarii]|nr:hypothetical protein [Halodesulfovibrio aestuarii]